MCEEEVSRNRFWGLAKELKGGFGGEVSLGDFGRWRGQNGWEKEGREILLCACRSLERKLRTKREEER